MTDHKDENSGGDEKTVMRLAVKLPPFWKNRPELWFQSADAQFKIVGITADETRYYTIVAAVDVEVLDQVSDILAKPPPTDKYEAIKNRLIERYADSEQQKIKKLLTEIELGDRPPTQLLTEMRKYASDKVSDDFLQTMWLNCLPQRVREILSTVDGNLDKLAKAADRIVEYSGANDVAAISRTNSEVEMRIASLEATMKELQKMMSKLLARGRHRSRSNSQHVKKDGDTAQCWYHARFAEKATKCIKPCAFDPTTAKK